jgi:hypothetical protein
MKLPLDRRTFLNLSVTGVAGLAATGGMSQLTADEPTDKPGDGGAADVRPLDTPEPKFPCGTIGKLKISRLILGSNLMSGYSHSRDLQYVGALMRAYNTEEKILETLALAESLGINTVSQGDMQLIQKYNQTHGGHLQQLAPLHIREDNTDEEIRTAIKAIVDQGSAAIYVFGHDSDQIVRAGRVEVIAKAIEWIKQEGLPAGVGGHSLHVVRECEKGQVNPDFYFKTFHSDRYWSATLKEYRDEYCWYQGMSEQAGQYHDNMWCVDPEATIETMREVKAAWIAFKVLAAGALRPQIGFRYALRNGADFMVVGMFDFQVQQNVELVKEILTGMNDRERPWRA